MGSPTTLLDIEWPRPPCTVSSWTPWNEFARSLAQHRGRSERVARRHLCLKAGGYEYYAIREHVAAVFVGLRRIKPARDSSWSAPYPTAFGHVAPVRVGHFPTDVELGRLFVRLRTTAPRGRRCQRSGVSGDPPRRRPGRPPTAAHVRSLALRMDRENRPGATGASTANWSDSATPSAPPPSSRSSRTRASTPLRPARRRRGASCCAHRQPSPATSPPSTPHCSNGSTYCSSSTSPPAR